MTKKELNKIFDRLPSMGYEVKDYQISNVNIRHANKRVVLGEELNGCKHKIQYRIEYFHVDSYHVTAYQKIAVYTEGQFVYPKMEITIPISGLQDILANEELEPQLIKLAAQYGVL